MSVGRRSGGPRATNQAPISGSRSGGGRADVWRTTKTLYVNPHGATRVHPKIHTPLSPHSTRGVPAEAMKTRSIVLVLLVMQTTAAVLLMRYSRTTVRSAGSGPPYLARLGPVVSGQWRHQ